ncbi:MULTISPECIES: thiamine phosphate synthase [Brevibacillus]|jgi:thiamine-phosphate pyrophosphorylase|uniref:Thiamine-phosphate synthase n=1 Tax=Brevibacillus parabrevis TaxID=54914 RepID=A0A4Y3PTX7_BREPA|nr:MULTISPECIES: thiamine phosphate synthase [Brevibacillus]MBU8711182.1 thiamine phosphate synthase [Brevibacillus parabrevis]MDH6350203.1 thiamine-phosphate pyrophosphorylase [Brevibacillus sp. 1238]MDR4999645.1 thiamine phosphate synthase [Brevibacillus parabrevis]MED2253793.1 thiamine phosphate synthase [Brevibacillus parabrevis]NRQ53872.1 thiamine phosphate synthase [Brevibacillus sp. HD1.4A]
MRDRQTLRDKMGVYFVIGTQDCGFSREKTVEIVREALAGGVGTLQLRDKGSKLTSEERCELGRQLQELCREHQTLFFVNDDVDLAVRLQADGIHVGQDDMHLAEVRAMVGEAMYIGISAGTVEEAIAAKNGGADCIGVGAMFATSSKADAGEPIGPAGLREIREAVGAELPIVGIGGITLENAKQVCQAGADGVAVISAISRAESPKQAAEDLLRIVRSI